VDGILLFHMNETTKWNHRSSMMCLHSLEHPSAFAGPFSIVRPANDQLQQIPLPAFVLLTTDIAVAEL
jgi:hypothetical protein